MKKCECGECFTCYKREYYQNNYKPAPFYHMTQQEIADELGMTQQAVYDLLRRALRKFKRNWIELHGVYEESPTDQTLLKIRRSSIIRRTLGTD